MKDNYLKALENDQKQAEIQQNTKFERQCGYLKSN